MINTQTIYPCLNKKNIVITGGATGIGAVIAKYFYDQKARVAILDIKKEDAIKLIRSMPSTKEKISPEFFYCDLVNVESIEKVFLDIHNSFGHLNVLCNNAADDERHDWEKITSQDWDFYQNRNLKHHFFCTREFSKYIDTQNGGSIICIGSISYLNGSIGMPSYTTAKSGLVGLINTMARILGPRKIRVNLIQPGWVMTEKQLKNWIDKKALEEIEREQILSEKIQPDEPAKLVLFLASDQSRLITKQIINIDGGWV